MHPIDQVTKQLHKLVNVLKIRDLEPDDTVARELALFKVAADGAAARGGHADLRDLPRQGRRRRRKRSIIVEITGTTEKIEAFEQMVRPFGLDRDDAHGRDRDLARARRDLSFAVSRRSVMLRLRVRRLPATSAAVARTVTFTLRRVRSAALAARVRRTATEAWPARASVALAPPMRVAERPRPSARAVRASATRSTVTVQRSEQPARVRSRPASALRRAPRAVSEKETDGAVRSVLAAAEPPPAVVAGVVVAGAAVVAGVGADDGGGGADVGDRLGERGGDVEAPAADRLAAEAGDRVGTRHEHLAQFGDGELGALGEDEGSGAGDVGGGHRGADSIQP